MLSQQLSRAHLIVPGKSTGAVGRELDIIRWISIDEIFRLDGKLREILVSKFPAPKQTAIGVKVFGVVDLLVLTERYVEFSIAIEATETIETSAVQKIKKLRRFRRPRATVLDELVEASAMRVEKLSVVVRFDF